MHDPLAAGLCMAHTPILSRLPGKDKEAGREDRRGFLLWFLLDAVWNISLA